MMASTREKTLRIKDKASSTEKAAYEYVRLLALKFEGKAIFSPTVYKAAEKGNFGVGH